MLEDTANLPFTISLFVELNRTVTFADFPPLYALSPLLSPTLASVILSDVGSGGLWRQRDSTQLASLFKLPTLPSCVTILVSPSMPPLSAPSRLQALGGQIEGLFLCPIPSYQKAYLEKTGWGMNHGWQAQLPYQGSPPHPDPASSHAVPSPALEPRTLDFYKLKRALWVNFTVQTRTVI